MTAEPVPLTFQLYFYSAIVIAIIFSLAALFLYRRVVRRNMIAKDVSDPVLPITPRGRAAVRSLPAGSASDFAVAERRLKMRLALIYGAAILGVALLASWIRFFGGNTTLIRGSIMFMMWRGYLGDAGALILSTALFAVIGVPLLAVLLAWNWRRAATLFVLYVGTWAAGAFTLIVLRGWSQADWASTLILAQISLIGIIAPQPFLLLLLTGHRRVRAVAPMTLAGSLIFCGVLLGAFSLTVEVYRLQLFPPQVLKLLGHSGVLFIVAGIMASLVCWCLLRLLASLYEKKVYSDCQLLVDCWSLLVILYVFARLGETPGTPQLLIAVAFAVFFVYLLWIHTALRVFLGGIKLRPNRRLLLLRTFGFQKRTERLFDAIGQRWRFHGPVLMIVGTDLAARTINPADYLHFLDRRLHQRFVRSDEDLQRNLDRLDDMPDPDGRYRVNELFCGDKAWYKALVALLDRADLVLMDLRGFGPNNSGCIFELQQLVERGPLGQVFLAVDDTTDRRLLDLTIQTAWSQLPEGARSEGAADLIVLPMKKQSPRAMKEIFVALQGANANTPSHSGPERAGAFEQGPQDFVEPGQVSAQEKPAADRQRWKGIAFLAVVAALLFAGICVWTRWGDAMTQFARTGTVKPDLAADHYNRGVNLDHQSDYGAAIGEYRKALAMNPDLAVAHYNLGVDLDHEGEHEAAIAEYRKALAVKPGLPDAHYNLGVDFDRQGDYETAVAEYGKELAVNAGNWDAHFNLGVDLFRKDSRETAIAEFRKALALKSNWAEAYEYVGAILFRQGNDEGAIAEFRKSLAAKPNSARAHLDLGMIFDHESDYPAAIAEYRSALALEPSSAKTHLNLARLLHATGRRSEAEREFREARSRNPELKRPWN